MKVSRPFVVTRAVKRIAHPCHELARGDRQFLLLVSSSGQGKTAVLRWLRARLLWEEPLEHVIETITDAEQGGDVAPWYTPESALAFAESILLVDPGTRDHAVAFLDKRIQWTDHGRVVGPDFRHWLDQLADSLGRPRPDALSLLRLYGIGNEVSTRYPVLVTGIITDTGRSLLMKLCEELQLPQLRGYTRSSAMYLRNWLRKLPVVIFLDEADTLSVEALREFQQVCSETGTPFLLSGTEQLVGRLHRNPQLRPLATRVELRMDLGYATAADLQAAFPHLAHEIVLTVWAASGRNFRIAIHIVDLLEEIRREKPGARLSKKAVAAVAQRVLAARAIRPEELEEAEAPLSPAAVAVAHALPAEIPARRMATARG